MLRGDFVGGGDFVGEEVGLREGRESTRRGFLLFVFFTVLFPFFLVKSSSRQVEDSSETIAELVSVRDEGNSPDASKLRVAFAPSLDFPAVSFCTNDHIKQVA